MSLDGFPLSRPCLFCQVNARLRFGKLVPLVGNVAQRLANVGVRLFRGIGSQLICLSAKFGAWTHAA